MKTSHEIQQELQTRPEWVKQATSACLDNIADLKDRYGEGYNWAIALLYAKGREGSEVHYRGE